ncbi:pyruvate kinase [Pseudofrankia asymbiotica]|uniref:Pyruvate kinase barrel domain-containing protein n=1 Tax=Pseudofrankia asymbiotica TaxID=1834516 RepID=A0A1V2IB73_9ACTN|nr:pyruvate kinase [Pseudofrankia asymbiotica]ONH28861.1 hypothetical protein BL253_18715 [Pseudofrankia asymbiotica]
MAAACSRPTPRLDDGKIGAVVSAACPDELDLHVTDTPPAGARLRGGRGINLPDTDQPVSALTAKDRADLTFVAAHADIVSLSFVQYPDDIDALHAVRGGKAEDVAYGGDRRWDWQSRLADLDAAR